MGDSSSLAGWARSAGGAMEATAVSCLENPADRGAWRAAVHGGCKESDTTE